MAAKITFLYDPNMNMKFFNLDVHYFYDFIRELDAQDAWCRLIVKAMNVDGAAASSASASATLTATAKTFSFRATVWPHTASNIWKAAQDILLEKRRRTVGA